MELTGRGVCTVREDERHAHVAEAGSAKHCLHCLLVLVGWLHFFYVSVASREAVAVAVFLKCYQQCH